MVGADGGFQNIFMGGSRRIHQPVVRGDGLKKRCQSLFSNQRFSFEAFRCWSPTCRKWRPSVKSQMSLCMCVALRMNSSLSQPRVDVFMFTAGPAWYAWNPAIWQWVKTLGPLVNIKIAGKWMFIPLKMVLIGIDPYPYYHQVSMFSLPAPNNHYRHSCRQTFRLQTAEEINHLAI